MVHKSEDVLFFFEDIHLRSCSNKMHLLGSLALTSTADVTTEHMRAQSTIQNIAHEPLIGEPASTVQFRTETNLLSKKQLFRRTQNSHTESEE